MIENCREILRANRAVPLIAIGCFLLLSSWSMGGVEAQAQTPNKVSCSGKTVANKLYKAEWTMLPAMIGTFQPLPSFDFYQCQWDTTRQAWLLYSFNCTGSRTGANPTTTEKYCNYFDEASQRCILDKPAAKCLPGQ